MKIRRFRKHLHFVFQLFIFSCWAFGILAAVVYTGNDSVFRGRSYFVGHYKTTLWVLRRLCCIPAGHDEQSFTRVMLKLRTGCILQREKRILCWWAHLQQVAQVQKIKIWWIFSGVMVPSIGCSITSEGLPLKRFEFKTLWLALMWLLTCFPTWL